jgi:S-adenosylmethionine:diacylglycerol 3-amino-3-carboxypropyl transferase
MKARIVNKYTPEGRAVIHKGLERIDKNILHYLMRNPVRHKTVEFNDNRLSCTVHSVENVRSANRFWTEMRFTVII